MTGGPLRTRAASDDGRPRDLQRPEAPSALPSPVVDTHCHLDIADGADGDWLPTAEAVRLAASVGVTRIVQIGCDLAGAAWAVDVASEHDAIVAGVALHPNEAPRLSKSGRLEQALSQIEHLAMSSDRVRVVGETGLDYFRTGPDGQAAQHESFRAHIAMARRHDKTLVIHDREAHEDVLRILDEEGVPDRVVMHCFSGDAGFARACVDRGCFLSFAGTVTFKNADRLREALAATPLDRVLVETDAPFLTPAPHRGRPNASYLIPLTLRRMAEVTRTDLHELCQAVDANTDRAFGGSW
jgi:TatD DNase family protein